MEAPHAARAGRREAARIRFPRRRSKSASRASRSARTIFRSGWARAAPARGTAREARPPLLLHARRQPRSHARASSSGRRDSRRCRRSSSIAAGSRTCCSRTNAELGVDGARRLPRARRSRSTPAKCIACRLARPDGTARDHRPLGRRRERPRRPAQAPARAGPAEHARRQRRVVAGQLAREDRRLVGRSGVAGARRRPGCAGRARST